MYSQFKEDDFIWGYFRDKPPGTLLDIGANDGRTFSNSRLLLEKGWSGVLVEPSFPAFEKLKYAYRNVRKAILRNYAISDHDGEVVFYESGAIQIGRYRDNIGLISTTKPEWLPRWENKVTFHKITAPCKTFASFLADSPFRKFDFISIDAEGDDLMILKQMDLGELGCSLLCIEHDHGKEIAEYLDYCGQWGFKEVKRNEVNLILTNDFK